MTVDKFPAVIQQLDAVSEKVLTPVEIAMLRQHIAEGAPGFMQYLTSERFKKTLRHVFEDYQSFLKQGS